MSIEKKQQLTAEQLGILNSEMKNKSVLPMLCGFLGSLVFTSFTLIRLDGE